MEIIYILFYILVVILIGCMIWFFKHTARKLDEREAKYKRINEEYLKYRLANKLNNTDAAIKENFFPYTKKKYFFSIAEKNFYMCLEKSLIHGYRVLSKVRMADVFYMTKGITKEEYYAAFNRIKAKHFDFIILEDGTYSIYAAIELDDGSHLEQDRQERDFLIEHACHAAGLKLVRFKVQNSYSPIEIRRRIFEC